EAVREADGGRRYEEDGGSVGSEIAPVQQASEGFAAHRAAGLHAEAARMSRSWDRSSPLRGENEPSKAADPIVKASAPASRRAWIRAGLFTLPATDRYPGAAARAARTRASGSASTARKARRSTPAQPSAANRRQSA